MNWKVNILAYNDDNDFEKFQQILFSSGDDSDDIQRKNFCLVRQCVVTIKFAKALKMTI